MEKLRVFEILDKLNVRDSLQGSRLVGVSNNFVSANKAKQGAHVTMGVEEICLHQIMNDEAIVVLLVIDKKAYEELTK